MSVQIGLPCVAPAADLADVRLEPEVYCVYVCAEVASTVTDSGTVPARVA